MTDIKLINENGVIKGVDPETGEEVPVSFEELSTERVNTKRHIVDSNVVSGDGSETDPFVVDNSIWDGGGHYHFPAEKELNHFETAGLKTPDSINWNETNVKLTGSGVRLTQLSLADGANDNVIEVSAPTENTGNFGGIEKMAVYGNESNNASGRGIEWSGRVIDPIFKDLIVRFCADEAIRLAGNVSGARLLNFWAENSSRGVFINGGTRIKCENGHIIGNSGNAFTISDGCNHGNYSNLTIYDNGLFGLIVGGNDNLFTNIHAVDNGDDDIYFLSDATENVAYGTFGTWRDDGTRNLINGWGTNSGDPNTTGEWNGHSGYAGRHGATIWDTTTSPWTPYEATPDGSWV